MVITPESPPEPLERPLAVLYASRHPAGEALGALFEGYALHLADAPAPDRLLRDVRLPPLAAAEGELRTAMGLSMARYLI